MPRRVAADVIPPHVYRRGDDGGCRHCPIPNRRNPVHVAADDPRLAEVAAAQEEHRRRTGDTE
jgi:hypothetical protein